MKKIIIIGSGLGGLTAGNLLAKKGHHVMIFESHTKPGGYIGGFWRKGFYFESGTHGISNSARIFSTMKDLGLLNKIKFFKHEPFRFVSADFDDIPSNYQELKSMIYNAYPTENQQLARFFAVVDYMYNTFKRVMSKGSRIKKIVPGLKMIKWFFFKYKNVSKTEFAERFFSKGSACYRLLSDMMGYPNMNVSILAPYFWGPLHDYWGVIDGMQSWADVLADNFKKLGGKLNLKSQVDKILVENNRAMGIISHGEVYDADYVIAACDYKNIFLKLLDSKFVPPTMTEKLQKTSVSQGWVIVYLGLNISNEKLRDLMQSNYIISYNLTIDTDFTNSKDETHFDHCRLELYSPSLKSPHLAPESKSSLVIMVIAPDHWMDNWGNGNREEYLKLKEKVTKNLIHRASMLIPNLLNMIEFQDTATPLTFERYTQNSDGATCAWNWNPHEKFYKNFWSINVKTPIDNLLIGSSWSNQLGGTSSAVKAALLCTKIIKK